MPGAYSTFDTLSLEWNESGPFGDAAQAESEPEALPVLARISRVLPADGTSSLLSFDAARRAAPPAYGAAEEVSSMVYEVRANEPKAVPLAPQPPVADEPPRPATSSFTRIDPPAQQIRVDKSAEESFTTEDDFSGEDFSEPLVDELEQQAFEFDEPEGLIGLLVRIETLVAPYSQVIVLLTLLAAAGLTVLLLRGEAAGPIDDRLPEAESIGPAITSAPMDTSDTLAPMFEPEESTPQLAARVKGPIGMNPGGAPRGVITGIGRLEPYREPALPTPPASDGVYVAQQQPLAPGAAPPYNALPAPEPTTEAPPVPRLSNIQPYQGHTR